jgi:hypothetical protein
MNFLFSSTVVDGGELMRYRVYEFKASPGKYKAELRTIGGSMHVKEITFWKDHGNWKTEPPTKDAKSLAEVIAMDIERHRE